ncbi:hypothetical protein ES703_79673 [subsurface metagenome]
MKQITIELDEDFLSFVAKWKKDIPRKLKELAVLELYRRKEISSGKEFLIYFPHQCFNLIDCLRYHLSASAKLRARLPIISFLNIRSVPSSPSRLLRPQSSKKRHTSRIPILSW